MFSAPWSRRGRRRRWGELLTEIRVWLLAMLMIGPMWGCRSVAPIHLWQPPQLGSVGGEKIVLMEIAGPTDTSQAIRDALIAQGRGERPGRNPTATPVDSIAWMLPEQLLPPTGIELVSNVEDTSSDLLVAAAARRSGVRYLLRGEIMHATGVPHSEQRLSVVWRLVGLDVRASTRAVVISIDQASIRQRFPDLMAVPDPNARLHQAMARRTIGLVRQSVVRQNVDLAKPIASLGSAAVRRGNDLARLGNWPAAEEIWARTLQRYPLQSAAWINASIAAAARQDFEQAQQRITRAIQLSAVLPVHRQLAEETLVWLELQQRDYLKSFDLPDPPGGWRVTHGRE